MTSRQEQMRSLHDASSAWAHSAASPDRSALILLDHPRKAGPFIWGTDPAPPHRDPATSGPGIGASSTEPRGELAERSVAWLRPRDPAPNASLASRGGP
jgi:hypothetical protein